MKTGKATIYLGDDISTHYQYLNHCSEVVPSPFVSFLPQTVAFVLRAPSMTRLAHALSVAVKFIDSQPRGQQLREKHFQVMFRTRSARTSYVILSSRDNSIVIISTTYHFHAPPTRYLPSLHVAAWPHVPRRARVWFFGHGATHLEWALPQLRRFGGARGAGRASGLHTFAL